MGLGLGQSGRVENFGGDTRLRIEPGLAHHRRHFFVVGRHPQGTAALIFDPGRHRWQELTPQFERVAAKRQLRGRIVHRHQMPHARGGGAAAGMPRVEHQNLGPAHGEFGSAGRSHQTGTHHHHVGMENDRMG